MTYSEIISDCQFWYSGVQLINSRGFMFSNNVFGGGNPKIELSGCTYCIFNQNLFRITPTFSISDSTYKFQGNYRDDDGAEVAP